MDGTELFQKNHNKFTHRLIVKLDNCLSLKSTHHDDLVVILSPRVLTKKIQMSYFKGSMGFERRSQHDCCIPCVALQSHKELSFVSLLELCYNM